MFYKRIFLFAVVLCMLKIAYPQSQTIAVFGYVHDVNDSPIEMVNIVIENSTTGTTSDTNGIFKLTASKVPLKLIFSHVSYKKQELKITKADLEKASETGVITLDIRMISNIKILPPVSISDSKIQLAYRNKKAWILDYELAGDYLILLLLEGNKKILRIVEEDNENNYIEKEISKDFQSLYKDGFGSLHLMKKDSAYQAFFSDSTIIIPYSTSIRLFNKLIKPVQIVIGNKWIYQKFSDYNQEVTYTLMDTEKKTEMLLTSVVNKEQSAYNQSYARDLYGTKFQQDYYEAIGQYMGESPSIEEKEAQERFKRKTAMVDAYFFFAVLSKPTYQPIKYINRKIYLFNHYEGKLSDFDEEGNTLSEKDITYQKDKQWANEIIVNEEHTRCFAKYVKDGLVTLHEIDVETGRIKGSLTLEEHAFPEKIRIKDDFVYYTYKESLYSDENKRYLWKQPLWD